MWPITSEGLHYISWKGNKRKASYGKEKTPIYKTILTIGILFLCFGARCH